eukprot:TRINITY_DN1669_c0_g1_i1.p1 TRINITY_DN1669_c0_g1~~TRINITY_DN1669_c0_g1_i1.p1  ORF type:complete len:250 (-),score=69.52 TRINITY_DN1669_c0_g1_i1:409-1086(-)
MSQNTSGSLCSSSSTSTSRKQTNKEEAKNSKEELKSKTVSLIDPLDSEEILAIGDGGSESDKQFDTIVGVLEELLMEPILQETQRHFMDRYVDQFEDTQENKLIYTDIFREYVDLVEKTIETYIQKKIPTFTLQNFSTELAKRSSDEIAGDVFDVLASLGEFTAFKELMLARKRELSSGVDALGFSIAKVTVSETKKPVEEEKTKETQQTQMRSSSTTAQQQKKS